MLNIHDLSLFVLAGVLLNLTPGPDTLFIVSHAAARGWPAGAMAALGIGAGCLVHVVAAAVGLSALLATSATAFAIVKWLGAAYLVWIGLTMLAGARPALSVATPAAAAAGLRTVFVRGALTNALNPKVAMFFVAFLPQFVDSSGSQRALSLLVLGGIFDLTGTLWNLTLAWLAAGAVRRIGAAARAAAWLSRGVGAAFVVLGLRLTLWSGAGR